MTTLILTELKERDAPGGWLVAEETVPIGIVTPNGAIRTPSGAEYAVRDGRLWPADGPAVAGYDEDAPSVTDLAGAVTWDLRPNWRAEALKAGPEGSRVLEIGSALAREYSLEEAQGAMPARIKLLLAWLALFGAAAG
jgi:hypothetical protein